MKMGDNANPLTTAKRKNRAVAAAELKRLIAPEIAITNNISTPKRANIAHVFWKMNDKNISLPAAHIETNAVTSNASVILK